MVAVRGICNFCDAKIQADAFHSFRMAFSSFFISADVPMLTRTNPGLFELSKERGSVWTEIGKKKISSAGKGSRAELLQFGSEPRAQALHFADVRLHRGVVLHGGFGGYECGKIHRKGRHGAAHERERLLACNDGAKPQRSKSSNF